LSTFINYLCLDPNDGNITNISGGKIKETGSKYWTSHNIVFNNSIGFKGLLGGIREGCSFIDIGNRGYWWSSTEYDTFHSVFLFLFSDQGSALISSDLRRKGFLFVVSGINLLYNFEYLKKKKWGIHFFLKS
jgi:hypothetical protein